MGGNKPRGGLIPIHFRSSRVAGKPEDVQQAGPIARIKLWVFPSSVSEVCAEGVICGASSQATEVSRRGSKVKAFK